MKTNRLTPLGSKDKKDLKKLEESISSLNRSVHDRLTLLEKSIKENKQITVLPPIEKKWTNSVSFNDIKSNRTDLNVSLRDNLIFKPHYVTYPKRKFVSSDNNTFVSLGTWSDKNSQEFDFRSILENKSHQYKRYPRLSNDKRPIWR